MGARRSCGPLRSRLPTFLDFSFAFRVPAFLYDIFLRSPVLSRSCFAFLCSWVNMCMCVGWGCNSSHARCVCMDGSGKLGKLATGTTTPPRHACTVYEYTGGKPVWGQTHISPTIPPFHLSSQYTS